MYDENIGIVEGMLGKLDSRLNLADSFIFYYLPLNLTKKNLQKERGNSWKEHISEQ